MLQAMKRQTTKTRVITSDSGTVEGAVLELLRGHGLLNIMTMQEFIISNRITGPTAITMVYM